MRDLTRMHLSRSLLGALAALVLPLPALAGTAAVPAPFAGFGDLCGYELRFISTDFDAKPVIDRDGTAVILLDPSLRWPGQADRRAYLLARACAHHRFGHTLPAQIARRDNVEGAVAQQELAADCWAARVLTERQRGDIARHAIATMRAEGEVSPGAGLPSGALRATTAERCSRTANAEADPDGRKVLLAEPTSD